MMRQFYSGDRREKRRLTLERRLCDLIGEKACRNEKREIKKRRKITSQIERRKTHKPNRKHYIPPFSCEKHHELKSSFSSHRVGKNHTPMALNHSALRARAGQPISVIPPYQGCCFPDGVPQRGYKQRTRGFLLGCLWVTVCTGSMSDLKGNLRTDGSQIIHLEKTLRPLF